MNLQRKAPRQRDHPPAPCPLPGSGCDSSLHAGELGASLQELGHARQHLLLSAGSAPQCWAAPVPASPSVPAAGRAPLEAASSSASSRAPSRRSPAVRAPRRPSPGHCSQPLPLEVSPRPPCPLRRGSAADGASRWTWPCAAAGGVTNEPRAVAGDRPGQEGHGGGRATWGRSMMDEGAKEGEQVPSAYC